MQKLNESTSQPLYQQLANVLQENIENGTYEKGKKIQTEQELMELFDVSRVTVRAAINILVEEGVLVKTRGRGTFVCEKKIERHISGGKIIGFSESVHIHGDIPGAKTLSIELVNADRELADFFMIDVGTQLFCIKRLRTINDLPVLIEKNYFPMSLSALMSDDLSGSIYDLLRNKYHVLPTAGVRSFEITRVRADESAVLGEAVGSPMLFSVDRCYGRNDEPIHICYQVIRGEKVKYYIYV